MAQWESEVLAEMPDGKYPGDPAFLGEIPSASGYTETQLFGPTAGDRWRTGRGNATAEDRTHSAGPLGAAVVETSAPPASPPGYELLDEIGRGGMGIVYRARDTALDRDAISAGWGLTDELKEPDFDAVRGRADFQKLLAEVEAKARPPAKE